jgi:hypothetical protein
MNSLLKNLLIANGSVDCIARATWGGGTMGSWLFKAELIAK